MNSKSAANIPKIDIIGLMANACVNKNHSETNILNAGSPAKDKQPIVANISSHLLAKKEPSNCDKRFLSLAKIPIVKKNVRPAKV